jgi:hypothetical protein
MTNLTDRQQQMLSFERQWWKRDEALVDELFGCALKQYRRELAELVELPAALACDPLLVRRLRRHAIAQGITRTSSAHPAGRARVSR